MFISSEAAAFSKYTNNYIVLRDDEVAVVTWDGHSLEDTRVRNLPFVSFLLLSFLLIFCDVLLSSLLSFSPLL